MPAVEPTRVEIHNHVRQAEAYHRIKVDRALADDRSPTGLFLIVAARAYIEERTAEWLEEIGMPRGSAKYADAVAEIQRDEARDRERDKRIAAKEAAMKAEEEAARKQCEADPLCSSLAPRIPTPESTPTKRRRQGVPLKEAQNLVYNYLKKNAHKHKRNLWAVTAATVAKGITRDTGRQISTTQVKNTSAWKGFANERKLQRQSSIRTAAHSQAFIERAGAADPSLERLMSDEVTTGLTGTVR